MKWLNLLHDHQICHASFSTIVGSKTSKSVFFAVAWHRVAWVTLGDIR